MGALEQRLFCGFEPLSPGPDAGLAARLGSGGLPSTLQPHPSPLLGPSRSWGQGAGGQRGAWLSDSFILRRRSLELAVLRRAEGRAAAANEGPGASRAPLCSAAGGGQGLREVGSGPLPLLPGVRCAPSLLPAWKWLRVFSSGE